MENLRKRIDVRLVTNEKKLDKLTSKPTYVSSKILNENLMAVHKVKETLTLNRPTYVGMCILDLDSSIGLIKFSVKNRKIYFKTPFIFQTTYPT